MADTRTELEKILAESDLWNWDFSSVEVGQSYSARLWSHAWKELCGRDKKEMIAAAVLTPLAAVLTGIYAGLSWQSFLTGVGAGVSAGVITLIATLVVIFGLHLLSAPKEIDEDLRADLAAGKKQIEEEKHKLRRIAAIAADNETKYLALATTAPSVQDLKGLSVEEIQRVVGPLFEIKKRAPHFIEHELEGLPATNDEYGMIVRDDNGGGGAFTAYVVPYSNYSNTRMVAPIEKVSLRISYICFVGEQSRMLTVERGAWFSEQSSELDFPTNCTPRRALIVTVEGEDQRVYAIRRDFDTDYEGPKAVRAELKGEIFSVHVSLLAESRRITVKNFVYILEMIRQPQFEIRLTDAVRWKGAHLGKFATKGFEFEQQVNEISMEINLAFPPDHFPDISAWITGVATANRERQSEILEEIKTWETQAADFIGLYLGADKKARFLKAKPSIDDGFAQKQKRWFDLVSLKPIDKQTEQDKRRHWELIDSIKSRVDRLDELILSLR